MVYLFFLKNSDFVDDSPLIQISILRYISFSFYVSSVFCGFFCGSYLLCAFCSAVTISRSSSVRIAQLLYLSPSKASSLCHMYLPLTADSSVHHITQSLRCLYYRLYLYCIRTPRVVVRFLNFSVFVFYVYAWACSKVWCSCVGSFCRDLFFLQAISDGGILRRNSFITIKRNFI